MATMYERSCVVQSPDEPLGHKDSVSRGTERERKSVVCRDEIYCNKENN